MSQVFKPGLYVITPQRYPDSARLRSEVRQALEGGAAMVQFRDKSGDADWRRSVAAAIQAECAYFEVPLIVNDDAQLAAEIGAAGVHLGRDDPRPDEARAVVGPNAVIGVSCYDDLDRARVAVQHSADYLAFGSVFPSGNKPQAVHCPLGLLGEARQFDLPLVAIGGITPENGRAVVEAGADSLAVIAAVFDAADIRRAAADFAEIWA